MKTPKSNPPDLSARIADDIRNAILSGELPVEERLPSEAELAEQFAVSRPTIREALKRLAAQSLIRSQRGAFGGAFVRRLRYEDARDMHVTTSTLLLSMNDVDFTTACEARYALESACAPMSVIRWQPEHLDAMLAEIGRQTDPDLDDVGFCASDVAFHRLFVDAAANPVLSYQLAGAVEAMQPLMNMITFSRRSRARIIDFHKEMVAAMEARTPAAAIAALAGLADYTAGLGQDALTARGKRETPVAGT